MPKFSKQARKDLSDAVRRYNSMRTRFIKKYHPTYDIPKADLNVILNEASNTTELRENIKALNDLKKLTDFSLSQDVEIPVTVAQVRTFKRLERSVKSQIKKELAPLEQQLQIAISEKDFETSERLMKRIKELSAMPLQLGAVRTQRGMQLAIQRYQRMKYYAKQYHTIKPIERDVVDKGHFIRAMGAMGFYMTDQGNQIYARITALTDREWANLVSANPDVLSLDYVYNFSVGAQTRMNQIAGALGMDISGDELVGGEEEE